MASSLRPSAACLAQRWASGWKKNKVVDGTEFEAAKLATKACKAHDLLHPASSRISAVHVDAALEALATPAAFPPLHGVTTARPATLAGAWASRQQAAASCAAAITPAAGVSADAEDVVPRHMPAAVPYIPPARRQGATAAVLAGCALAYPPICPTAVEPAQPAQPAAYVPHQRRTAEQQAAATQAGRPSRPCPFPYLTAGPLPQPAAEAPLPLYRLALLYPYQCCF